MSEQWLSIVEYARAYNVSDMTVRRRIRNGKLNAVLKDGKYYIPVGELEPVSIPAPAQPITAAISEPVNFRSQQGVQPSGHGSIPTNFQKATYSQPEKRPNQITHRSNQPVIEKGYVPISLSGLIPNEIAEPLNREENVEFAAQNLLSFCEAMAKRLERSEKIIRREYDAKLREMEKVNQIKDLEINKYKQEVEDLQVLVNMIDRSRK